MNEIQLWNFNGTSIRTATLDNEIFWVAKDVCSYFGDSDHKRSVSRLDDDEKCLIPITDSMGRIQHTSAISEPGLYSLLFNFQPEKSRKDGANDVPPHILSRIEKIKEFKRWITHEVLPIIRKTGAYLTPKAEIDFQKDPIAWGEKYLAIAKIEREKRLQAEKESSQKSYLIEAQKPLVSYAETCMDSNSITETTAIAKQLGISGKALNAFLHENGIIYRIGKCGAWVVYSGKSLEQYGKLINHHFQHSDGSIGTSELWKWNERGRMFIINLWRSKHGQKQITVEAPSIPRDLDYLKECKLGF